MDGLDYNTQRDKLILPEYGREIQSMVRHAVALESKNERQRCAETIVEIMSRMFPQNRDNADYKQKLWDQLAIISEFKLDIDWPYDVSAARTITSKPQPMGYPMSRIPVRHYGKMIFGLLDKLKTMPQGKERDELIQLTANQMKQNLSQWSHGSSDDEKVASDLAKYTEGAVQLDLSKFKFDKTETKETEKKHRKK